MVIENILANPVYAGLLHAKSFKEHPEGLFPAIHEPIIDMVTWKMVQSKLKKPTRHRTIIDDAIPLRGILKCHCGNLLTGAASRGKSGKYFHYYKCRFSKHLNVSAKKAHEQFESILELMSLPAAEITKIRASARKEVKQELDNNMKRLAQKKSELEAEKTLLYSIEEKYIKNEIDQDTYRRWSDVYKEKIDVLETAVIRLEMLLMRIQYSESANGASSRR